jgi:hypothetical protein
VKHFASPKFWAAYEALPAPVRELANANYVLLKQDPRHPSLQFKKVSDATAPFGSGCATVRSPLTLTAAISSSGSARTPITTN